MSALRREGPWEIRSWEGINAEYKQLAECPLSWCDYEFEGAEDRSTHFFEEHNPEEFGLEPLSNDYDGQSSLSSFDGGDQ